MADVPGWIGLLRWAEQCLPNATGRATYMQKKTWGFLISLVVIAAIGLGVYYYTKKEPEKVIDLTAVAAVVDQTDVLEADVTFTIEGMRLDYEGKSLSDQDWAVLLDKAGYTPESLREYVIKNQFALPIMVLNDAAEAGVFPDSNIIDNQIKQQKEAIGDDKAWTEYLHKMGFAEESAYRRLLECQNVVSPYLNIRFGESTPTDEEKQVFIETYASYMTGKRSSAVAIAITDEVDQDAAMLQALNAQRQIRNGNDFGSVSDSFSSPQMELKPGGDMGWTAVAQQPPEYMEALDELAVGQVSDPIVTENCVYIIKCTDEFIYPEEGFTVDMMPESLQEGILEYLTSDYLASSRPAEYYDGLLESDRIVINAMPEGLSYDVDMSLADQPVEGLPELGVFDEVVGTGAEAQSGDLVRVTYVGKFEDGSIFDASEYHDGYFEFTIDQSSVIKGWHQGVKGMRVGGKRLLIIPPHLGYGEEDHASIPGGSTLYFEIELLSVNGDDSLGDGGAGGAGGGGGAGEAGGGGAGGAASD